MSAATAEPATAAPTPTADSSSSSDECGYDSTLVNDATIPDGTDMLPGTTFTKSWKIENTGCHTWPANLELVFVSGNRMSGPNSVTLVRAKPDERQTVSVDLEAPNKKGTYTGYWRLEDPDGNRFGQTFDVQIQVVSAVVTFDASYAGAWTCKSGKTTRYEYGVAITNTSTLTFKSASWTLISGKTVINSLDDDTPFQTILSDTNCGASGLSVSSLAPGDTGWISGYVAKTALPAGKSSHLELEICSADGLGGTCATDRVDFTP